MSRLTDAFSRLGIPVAAGAVGCLLLSSPAILAEEEPARPISFVGDVLPILSKAGCSGSSCHSKPDGQNGFRLSVFAYDPEADYREIVSDVRGRRVTPGAPEKSVLLLKATQTLPHEGGQRIVPGSEAFATVSQWIRDGLVYRNPDDPDLVGISIAPADGIYAAGDRFPLSVKACYSDGAQRDVTRFSHFTSLKESMAAVDESGLVEVRARPGAGVVVARFMGEVAVSHITVPASASEKIAESAEPWEPRNFIDEMAGRRFEKLGLAPSALCTDAEFLRRASLDLTGRLPDLERTREFLADTSETKRDRLIDSLLDDPSRADHWAVKWADLFRPNTFRVGMKSVYVFDQWLREAFQKNTPYDVFAREILTAEGSTHRDGPTVVFRDRREPADRATIFSQVFLGVRLECAKCHHHPNERWSQSDFYGMAAFFGQLKRKGKGISPPISGSPEYFYHAPGGEVRHPVTSAVLAPRALGDETPATVPEGGDPRAVLAAWITAPDNPFFARAAVNRVWAEMLGRGFVEPVDDFRVSNPPSHPELLDALAADFVRHGFDLAHLMRTIARSRLYQLSSLPNATNAGDTENYSRAYRRRIPAEPLAEAVAAATGVPATYDGLSPHAGALQIWNRKTESELLDAFGRPDASSDCPCERNRDSSMIQALHLMHSQELQRRLSADSGKVARLAESDLTERAIVEELYLAAYCRHPTDEELEAALEAFAGEGVNRRQAAEDILWALLNTAEFVFNH